jgi:outer membrane protein assembly factor BamE (lipoprotein component of BamABCDE complex)
MMVKQKIILVSVVCLFLTACTGIKSNNGYMPVQGSIDKLKVNKSSSSFTKSELGEPTLILGNREPIFIYASQVTERVLFFEPKVVSRDVLVLYFNKKKKLKKIDKFDLKDSKSFDLNVDTTDLKAQDDSLMSTLFSNFGLLPKSQVVD